jgi:hypothetical protein
MLPDGDSLGMTPTRYQMVTPLGMTPTQLEAFLVSALIASNSLLLSVFGNLYSIYAAYMRDGSAPICTILRRICFCLTLIIILFAVTALYIIGLLYSPLVMLAFWIPYSLSVVILLIAIMPIIISWNMYNDARP